jgi:hypothetical protein
MLPLTPFEILMLLACTAADSVTPQALSNLPNAYAKNHTVCSYALRFLLLPATFAAACESAAVTGSSTLKHRLLYRHTMM